MPSPTRLLADKGCDANSLCGHLSATETQAVIAFTRSRKMPMPYDAQAYRARNLIEHAFCKLKDCRRIATRYDKRARNFASAVAIVISWWS